MLFPFANNHPRHGFIFLDKTLKRVIFVCLEKSLPTQKKTTYDMTDLTQRFLKYVKFDTQSDEETNLTPSTPGQMIFAQYINR